MEAAQVFDQQIVDRHPNRVRASSSCRRTIRRRTLPAGTSPDSPRHGIRNRRGDRGRNATGLSLHRARGIQPRRACAAKFSSSGRRGQAKTAGTRPGPPRASARPVWPNQAAAPETIQFSSTARATCRLPCCSRMPTANSGINPTIERVRSGIFCPDGMQSTS